MPAQPHPQDTPIRVLMVCKACVVGTYQRKLEEIAAHPGIELTVVVPPYWQDTRGRLALERVHTDGYRLVVLPMRFNGNFHLHTYAGLRGVFESVRPHIAHIDEEPYNLATYQAMRLARRAGAHTIFFSWQNLDRRYPPPFRQIERWVLRHADYGLVGTEEAAAIWRGKGYTGPLKVLPQFGVDPDFFAPGTAARPADQPFTLGYAGRLVPEKGLDVLIEAVYQLPGRWILRLLGSGPEEAPLKEQAGVYNISGSVSFEQPVGSTQMPAFYRGLDAFVLPSLTRRNWKEQFGRVLIEAMACGVPVVGAESGAIPEVIGEAGLTFPEGDHETLTEHLHALATHPALRAALGAQGRERVLAHFTQARIAAETVSVYRELAADSFLTRV